MYGRGSDLSANTLARSGLRAPASPCAPLNLISAGTPGLGARVPAVCPTAAGVFGWAGLLCCAPAITLVQKMTGTAPATRSFIGVSSSQNQ